jgi:hypothetical protein
MRLKAVSAITSLAVLCAAAPVSASEWPARSVLVIEADRPDQHLWP